MPRWASSLLNGRIGTRLKWFIAAYALNILIAIPFFLNRSSGTSSAWYSFPLDDTWIHLDYVRGLVTQGCLCYNDGVWEGGATSWGWVFILSPFYAVFHLGFGLALVPIVKFVGLAIGALITVFIYKIARRITGSRRTSMVIAIIVALEPTFAFHRISGMEGVLVVVAVLGTTLALLGSRWLLAGLAMTVAFLARPEMALFLIVVYPIIVILWMRASGPKPLEVIKNLALARYSDNPSEQTRNALTSLVAGKGRLRDLGFALFPPAIAVAIWMAYNVSINGTIYPNTYLVKHDATLPFLPFGNAWNLFKAAMTVWQPWLAGWKLPIALIAYGFGSFYMLRRLGIAAIPLLVAPLVILFGAAKGERFENPFIVFISRRYVDPTAPLIVFGILIGTWGIFVPYRDHIVNRMQSVSARAIRLTPLSLLVVLAVTFTTFGALGKWAQLAEDYSWNTQNIHEVDVEAGMWLKENTPEDANVLVFDAGAIRYFSERNIIDVVGLNSREFMGREHVDVVFTEQPDYVAIFSVPQYESMPHAKQLAFFDAPHNTILGFGEVGIWDFDWSPDFFDDPEIFTGVVVEGDIVDTVITTDAENEIAHNYRVEFVGYAPRTAGFVNAGDVPIRDRGIAISGFEEFTVQAQPGTDLVLVLRYRATLTQPAVSNVIVNGVLATTIDPPVFDLEIQETSIRIPAEFITSDSVDVRIDWNLPITIFRWWSVIPTN
ncbi:hypothetical protein JYU04_03415 [Dehalococcoides mccartyi]|nr:hypothetical protein [Dehalococcoides mccartyi]